MKGNCILCCSLIIIELDNGLDLTFIFFMYMLLCLNNNVDIGNSDVSDKSVKAAG